MGGKSIKLFSDSRLVVGQVKGEFEAKDERMRGYHIGVPFQGLICYVFISTKPNHSWKRCMKESVEVIPEADP